MNKPIFIIGCPRSGTTLALNIIARHEELAWVSNIVNRQPSQLNKTGFNRIYDLPFIGGPLYLARTQDGKSLSKLHRIKNVLPAPVEPWAFWNSNLQNFQWKISSPNPPRAQTRSDISSSEVLQIKSSVKSLCQHQNKERFLSKYTDFPRMTYLNEAFPDAVFIHIVRDGRAVASSYLEKIEDGEFGTWDEREAWISGWPESWRDEWLTRYGTPLSFVAYQWKYFISEIWKDSGSIDKSRYLEVHYKDIIGNPHITFDRIFEFCDLGKSKRVASYLDNIHLGNMDNKWKNRFSDDEKEILNDIVGEGKFQHLFNSDE